jgi:hypothetical protein
MSVKLWKLASGFSSPVFVKHVGYALQNTIKTGLMGETVVHGGSGPAHLPEIPVPGYWCDPSPQSKKPQGMSREKSPGPEKEIWCYANLLKFGRRSDFMGIFEKAAHCMTTDHYAELIIHRRVGKSINTILACY